MTHGLRPGRPGRRENSEMKNGASIKGEVYVVARVFGESWLGSLDCDRMVQTPERVIPAGRGTHRR